MKPTFTSRSTRVAALGLSLALAACAAPRTPYTAADAATATVGIPGARSWGDLPDPAFEALAKRSRPAGRTGPPIYLALSGGGGDGAYGAGLLNGWTRSGQRPAFTVVSGVSTGALIAPFAFLGPSRDATLTELYTSGVAETLLDSPDLFAALFGSSIFSNDRLRTLVERYVTPELVAEIGQEGERGRRLFVLTTDIDAQRPVVWNMTEIARQRTPEAVALFRTVLVASASIPAVFPPVLIGAEANGKRFEEMHVDGSVAANVFTLPRSVLMGGAPARPGVRGGRAYIVLNTSPLPAFSVTENRATSIAGRTISMGVKGQTRGDLALTYRLAQRSGVDFNLAFIDPVDPAADGIAFDTAAMRSLYDRGDALGQTGRFWRKTPPREGALATTSP